jgi:hypothetical protein
VFDPVWVGSLSLPDELLEPAPVLSPAVDWEDCPASVLDVLGVVFVEDSEFVLCESPEVVDWPSDELLSSSAVTRAGRGFARLLPSPPLFERYDSVKPVPRPINPPAIAPSRE